MFSNQRTRRLHVTVLQCYNSVAKLDLPFKKTQPQLLVRGCNCWEAALNVKDSHSYSWLQYLMPNVCTIECYAFKLDTKYIFCLCSGLSTHSYSYSITQLSWWTRRIELSLPSFFFGQVVFSSKINLAPFFNLIFFPVQQQSCTAVPSPEFQTLWVMLRDTWWMISCVDCERCRVLTCLLSSGVVCQAAGEGEAGVRAAEWAGRDERLPGASQEKEQCRYPADLSWKCVTNQVLQSQPCHTSSHILFCGTPKHPLNHMHPLSADGIFFP